MKFIPLLAACCYISGASAQDHPLLVSHDDARKEAAKFAKPGVSDDPGASINCTAGGTPCDAGYSAIGVGCCPYDNAVCCDNKQTCCPSDHTCVDTSGYLAVCVPNNAAPAEGVVAANTSAISVCKSGPNKPFSDTLPNILIIGDSVSIGYTPHVAEHMANRSLVLHSPLDTRDGGAEETAYGEQCLEYFLHSPAGEFLKPDVIMFNWGLHDGPLGNSTVPGQAGLPDVYAAQLTNITKKLKELQPQAKLLFALTSPQMCDATGDGCVVNLNNQAKSIMDAEGIRTINLHDAIVGQCGEPPQPDCWGVKNCFCPHCGAGGPNQGYDWVAEHVIVPALDALIRS